MTKPHKIPKWTTAYRSFDSFTWIYFVLTVSFCIIAGLLYVNFLEETLDRVHNIRQNHVILFMIAICFNESTNLVQRFK